MLHLSALDLSQLTARGVVGLVAPALSAACTSRDLVWADRYADTQTAADIQRVFAPLLAPPSVSQLQHQQHQQLLQSATPAVELTSAPSAASSATEKAADSVDWAAQRTDSDSAVTVAAAPGSDSSSLVKQNSANAEQLAKFGESSQAALYAAILASMLPVTTKSAQWTSRQRVASRVFAGCMVACGAGLFALSISLRN